MKAHSLTPVYAAWAALMVSTLLSWLLAADHGSLLNDRVITGSAVILIAFVKIYLVGRYFMDLRLAPLALRLPFNFWTLATCVLVIAMYATS